MMDGILMDEEWRKHYSLKGSLLLGNTAAEGSVVGLVMSQYPITDPRPSRTALMDTLSIISAEKADAILKAYNITPESKLKDVSDALLRIIEDVMWCKPTEALASISRSHGLRVEEYTFKQLQPFGVCITSLSNTFLFYPEDPNTLVPQSLIHLETFEIRLLN